MSPLAGKEPRLREISFCFVSHMWSLLVFTEFQINSFQELIVLKLSIPCFSLSLTPDNRNPQGSGTGPLGSF